MRQFKINYADKHLMKIQVHSNYIPRNAFIHHKTKKPANWQVFLFFQFEITLVTIPRLQHG
jgi:hypothetical protein